MKGVTKAGWREKPSMRVVDVERRRDVERVRKAADSIPNAIRRSVGGVGIFEKIFWRVDWLFILFFVRWWINECVFC